MSRSTVGTNDGGYKASNSWIIALICIYTALICAATRFKVAPTMVVLMTEFGVGTSMGSWLMSTSTLVGIIFAIPVGPLLLKFGPRNLTIFSLAVSLVATIAGTLCISFVPLLITRFFEGTGVALATICLPAIISQWFPKEKLGLPMALFSCWIGLGILLISNVSEPLMQAFGSWHAVWWFCAVLQGSALILFVLFVHPKMTDDSVNKRRGHDISLGTRKDYVEAVRNGRAWAIILVMLIFAAGAGSILTFASTYMTLELGMDAGQANGTVSIMTMAMISGGLMMGCILTRFEKKWRAVFLISALLTALVFTTEFMFTVATALPYMVVGGIILQMLPAACFAMIPVSTDNPAVVGVLMANFTFFENLGAALGPAITGVLVEKSPDVFVWSNATPFLTALGILAVIFAGLYYTLDKHKEKREQAEGGQ